MIRIVCVWRVSSIKSSKVPSVATGKYPDGGRLTTSITKLVFLYTPEGHNNKVKEHLLVTFGFKLSFQINQYCSLLLGAFSFNAFAENLVLLRNQSFDLHFRCLMVELLIANTLLTLSLPVFVYLCLCLQSQMWRTDKGMPKYPDRECQAQQPPLCSRLLFSARDLSCKMSKNLSRSGVESLRF